MPLIPISEQQQSNARSVDRLISDLAIAYEGAYGVELYKDIEPKIKLNYLSSKMATLYEKLRYSVDYKEEHLLRRSAIERIVKRVILVNRKNPLTIAETLLHELIRAQYLPNDSIPENKAETIAVIINKHLKLYDQLSLRYQRDELKAYHKIMWGVMAAEIEEIIIPPTREDALIETLYTIVKPRVNLLNYEISERELYIQIYIALHRNIIKSDETLLNYYLLKYYFPTWETIHDETIATVADHFPKLVNAINKQLRHPLGEVLQKKLHNVSVYFTILNDILAENREHLKKTLSIPDELGMAIQKACSKRYGQARKKLRRGAVRSVIYIFVTKVMIATAIELPYDLFILGHINYTALGANIFFHPLLMASIVLTTSVPKEKNTKKIKEGITKLVYGEELDVITIKFRKSAQLGSGSWLVINIFYLLMYLLSFGVLISILVSLGFNVLSGFMFVLFLTLISFFGIRLRQHARELNVLGKRENIFSFLFDLFTLPIIRAGRWISLNSQRINVFIFILDFFIETPYQFIVQSFEEISSFIRDKKDQVD